MRKLLVTIILAFSIPVMANTTESVHLDGLTAAQITELKQQAEKMRSTQPANVSATVRKEAEAWGELGANMGKAMVGAAKEVGVAADEFSKTTLGKIVVFIVAYKLIGQDLLAIFIGLLVLVVGTSLTIWLAFTTAWYDREYAYVPVLWGLFNRKVITKVDVNDDARTLKAIGCVLLLAFTYIAGLNIII